MKLARSVFNRFIGQKSILVVALLLPVPSWSADAECSNSKCYEATDTCLTQCSLKQDGNANYCDNQVPQMPDQVNCQEMLNMKDTHDKGFNCNDFTGTDCTAKKEETKKICSEEYENNSKLEAQFRQEATTATSPSARSAAQQKADHCQKVLEAQKVLWSKCDEAQNVLTDKTAANKSAFYSANQQLKNRYDLKGCPSETGPFNSKALDSVDEKGGMPSWAKYGLAGAAGLGAGALLGGMMGGKDDKEKSEDLEDQLAPMNAKAKKKTPTPTPKKHATPTPTPTPKAKACKTAPSSFSCSCEKSTGDQEMCNKAYKYYESSCSTVNGETGGINMDRLCETEYAKFTTDSIARKLVTANWEEYCNLVIHGKQNVGCHMDIKTTESSSSSSTKSESNLSDYDAMNKVNSTSSDPGHNYAQKQLSKLNALYEKRAQLEATALSRPLTAEETNEFRSLTAQIRSMEEELSPYLSYLRHQVRPSHSASNFEHNRQALQRSLK